jgi:hypothetical protein
MNGIKTTPADKYFSLCIRERAGWRCERCGRVKDSLQCAHIFGRANKAVRLEPLNAFALCFSCHLFFTANPMRFAIFVHRKLNIDEYGILNEKSLNITIGKEVVQAVKSGEAAKHYKTEYKRMLSVRAEGVTGRLEFSGYL